MMLAIDIIRMDLNLDSHITLFVFQLKKGWSGGAMGLDKLPVLGCPTI